jgi:hypothetical protein
MATLIYDSKITNKDEILKRIALVGYDSEKFHAEEAAYTRFLVVASMRAADVKEILLLKSGSTNTTNEKENN